MSYYLDIQVFHYVLHRFLSSVQLPIFSPTLSRPNNHKSTCCFLDFTCPHSTDTRTEHKTWNQGDKVEWRSEYFTDQVSPCRFFIICKGKHSNYTVEKPHSTLTGWSLLTPEGQMDPPSLQTPYPEKWCPEEDTALVLARDAEPESKHEEPSQAYSETLYNITDISEKYSSMSWKTKKGWGTIRLKETEEIKSINAIPIPELDPAIKGH